MNVHTKKAAAEVKKNKTKTQNYRFETRSNLGDYGSDQSGIQGLTS